MKQPSAVECSPQEKEKKSAFHLFVLDLKSSFFFFFFGEQTLFIQHAEKTHCMI